MHCNTLSYFLIIVLEVLTCLQAAMLKEGDSEVVAGENNLNKEKRAEFPRIRFPAGQCFPSTVKVSLQDGASIPMSQLHVGNKVQTVSSGGSLIYSEVKGFMKKDYDVITMYKSITTSCNKTITLTRDHLIYTRRRNNEKFYPIYAIDVSVGDELLVKGNKKLIPTKIIDIADLIMEGAFTPVTKEGSIITDEVLASCYAFGDHDLAHISVTPMMWIPAINNLVLGDDSEIPVYIKIAETMGNMVFPSELK